MSFGNMKLCRAPTFPREEKSEKPFYEQPQPREYFVPTAAPALTPEPGPGESTRATLNPKDAYIVDFYFDKAQGKVGQRYVSASFSRDDMIDSRQNLDALMEGWYRANKTKVQVMQKKSLRWIHIPWNSMLDMEKLMKKVCVDIGLEEAAAMGSILSNDKWDDILHNMNDVDQGVLATYMQTSCLEVTLSKNYLKSAALKAEAENGKSNFIHRGANMAIFMPFIHWGTKGVLDWRTKWVEEIKQKLHPEKTGHWPPTAEELAAFLPHDAADEEKKFYVDMMGKQLLDPEKPLHLRRTLDQWYYSTTCDTSKTRDNDQIVTKFGPDKDKDKIPIPDEDKAVLVVDQLWLWILGGETVVTCFDRRWEKDQTFQANILDKIILWTLKQKAEEVRSGYDLVHLILNEVSGFFFNYSSTLNRAIRFHEIFTNAISKLNNKQAKLFQRLANLNKDGPIWSQKGKEQDKIFNLRGEFAVVRQIRDVLDELGMISKVYDEQCSILDALADFQYYDALFRGGYTDECGNAKRLPGTNKPSKAQKSGKDEGKTPEGSEVEDTDNQEPVSVSSVPVNWDDRDWYRRTKRLLYKYRGIVDGMIVEASDISSSLQNTIDLKQNSGSLFEAHASRKEAEMIMVFTLVSSIILPLSFFTSVFGMNVAELNDAANPVTLKVAMAYIVPLSALLLFAFAMFAFYGKVSEFVESRIRHTSSYEKKRANKRWAKSELGYSETSEEFDGDNTGDEQQAGVKSYGHGKTGLFRGRWGRSTQSQEHEMGAFNR